MGILTQRLALGGQASRMTDDLSKGGFSRPAHISIADNRFTLVNAFGDQMVWPNLALDVVIAATKPETIRSYFAGRLYDPKADKADQVPVCASQDGITPDDWVSDPQSDLCGRCPQNKFGSHPNGRGGKACQEYKRLAVAVVGDPNPMAAYLFGIPSASHKALRDYAAYCSKLPQSPDLHQIVTRVEFESQGVLKFQPVAWCDEALSQHLLKMDQAELFDAVLAVQKGDQTPRLNAPAAGVGGYTEALKPGVGVGRLPPFGNSPAPIALDPNPSIGLQQTYRPSPSVSPPADAAPTAQSEEFQKFLAWKAQQEAARGFVEEGQTSTKPPRRRRTKAEMEEARASQPGKGSDAPQPPQALQGQLLPPGTDAEGFQPPASFQPSPNNPFVVGSPTNVGAAPQGPAKFGIQGQPSGLTDAMRGALGQVGGNGSGLQKH